MIQEILALEASSRGDESFDSSRYQCLQRLVLIREGDLLNVDIRVFDG